MPVADTGRDKLARRCAKAKASPGSAMLGRTIERERAYLQPATSKLAL